MKNISTNMKESKTPNPKIVDFCFQRYHAIMSTTIVLKK